VIGKIVKAVILEGVATLKPVIIISIKIIRRETDFISPNYKKGLCLQEYKHVQSKLFLYYRNSNKQWKGNVLLKGYEILSTFCKLHHTVQPVRVLRALKKYQIHA
jgi:hypothetical protein